jgi:hypothetical protein
MEALSDLGFSRSVRGSFGTGMAHDRERALVAVSICLKRIVGRLFKLLEQGS